MNLTLLLEALFAFFKIGAFSFGGGYAVLSFITKEVVEKSGWISPSAFVDIVAVAEMTPGPIAVNASTFVGYTLFGSEGIIWGILGGVLCTLAVIAVPFSLATTAAAFMNKFKDSALLKNALSGIRPAVIGLIAASCYSIGRLSFTDLAAVLIFGITLLLIWKCKLSPIIALLAAGGLGILVYGFII